jgi:A/G-specific adenine glycosylase
MTIANKILKWFDKQGRKNLPWQQNPSLYRVWVSEIMLQQTQVNTVIPYYERFMKKFPEVSNLAKAPVDAVLKEWTGLGYYARARNLHKTAVIILEKYQGIFPKDYEGLLQLPGIGRSTAGAILALSTQQRYPILDGNVKRVLARLYAVPGWPSLPRVSEKLWEHSENLTPKKRVHHYTQAMMDLGATICTRSKPKCDACPLSEDCLALALGKQQEFPNKRPTVVKPQKKTHLLMMLHPEKHAVLLEKRPTKGIWGGLWSFPEYEKVTQIPEIWNGSNNNVKLKIQSKKFLPGFRHTFTHYHLDIEPVLCRVKFWDKMRIATSPEKNRKDYYWHPLNSPLKKGVAAPVKRLLEEVLAKT